MAFKIVNETYTTLPGEKPEKHGYVEGYTSNTVGATYLRLNVMSIPDEEQYNTYKRTGALRHFEYRPGNKYGTGVRLSRKQVIRLIWELVKWLVKGY
jgi:hypothetical protein